MSDDSLWLLDGLGSYFAACLRRKYPHLRWILVTEERDLQYHQPVLSGFVGVSRLAPPQFAHGDLSVRLREPAKKTWLVEAFDMYDNAARRYLEQGLDLGSTDTLPIDDVEVSPVVGDPDWDAEMWVPEWAEAVLGERVFGELAGRLSGIEGVADLAWEDRTVPRAPGSRCRPEATGGGRPR